MDSKRREKKLSEMILFIILSLALIAFAIIIYLGAFELTGSEGLVKNIPNILLGLGILGLIVSIIELVQYYFDKKGEKNE